MQIQKALVSERTAPAERKKVRNNMDFKVLLETIDNLDEKITKDTPMGDVISDFQQSDAPQFKGKSKEKRKQMALAAKLSKESVEDLNSIRRLSGLEEADEQDIMDKLQAMADGPDGEDELLMKMEMGIGEEGMFLRKLYDKVSNKMFSKDAGDLEDPEDFDKVHAEVMQMFGIKAVPIKDLQKQATDRMTRSALDDPELTGEDLEEDMDLSDKTEELTQWFIKYDGYRGDNGDALPMGWIKSMTATGVGPDGWEVKEWNAYQDKLGKDITDMDDEEIDAFIDNPNNSPITSAMIDDLLKITGASTADEDLARAVSSAIGIGESLDEGFDRDSFRKAFEAMVEAKAKPDFLDVDKDGDKKEPMKKAAKEAGKSKGGKKEMSDKQKKYFGKKNESVEEGKSKHAKGSEKYKKQMAAKHASMNEDEMDMDMEIDTNMDMPMDPDQVMPLSVEPDRLCPDDLAQLIKA